jgi:hypothetical protein
VQRRETWIEEIDSSEARGDHEDCEFSAFKDIQAPMLIECVSCRRRPGVQIGFACRGSQRIVPPREASIYPAAATLRHHVIQSKDALTHGDFVVLTFPAVPFSPQKGEANANAG